jgi:alpha-L-fucosidase
MGFYYSLYEWFNPLYKTNFEQYVDYHMMPQMKDLVTRYRPDIFWPDGEWDHTSDEWKSQQFLQWLYNDSPVKDSVAVNDRWGKETRGKHGGYYTTEYGLVGNQVGLGKVAPRPWEECRGIGTSFGYNRIEDLRDYSSSKQLVDLLITKVSEGGNLLLDIGPTADGRIPVIMQERLLDMGDWLKVNGSAIYATTPWKNQPKAEKDQHVFFTTSQNTLYVICTKWPAQPLAIPNINPASKVSLMGSDAKVSTTFDANVVTINAPIIAPDSLPCQYAWVFKVENFE